MKLGIYKFLWYDRLQRKGDGMCDVCLEKETSRANMWENSYNTLRQDLAEKIKNTNVSEYENLNDFKVSVVRIVDGTSDLTDEEDFY
jgi:hypothetical protein